MVMRWDRTGCMVVFVIRECCCLNAAMWEGQVDLWRLMLGGHIQIWRWNVVSRVGEVLMEESLWPNMT